MRSALEWAYSLEGDAGTGATLTAICAPMFLRLSLLDEYRRRVEQALQGRTMTQTSDLFVTMNLNLALGHLLLHMEKDAAQMRAAFAKALQTSEQIDVAARGFGALAGMWLGTLFSGDYPAALALAQRARCGSTDSNDDTADLVYARMMALTLHFMGEFAEARHFVEYILQHPHRSAPLEHDKVFYIDLEVATYTVSARNAWIEGYPDRASDMARHGVERAISINNAVGICYAARHRCLAGGRLEGRFAGDTPVGDSAIGARGQVRVAVLAVMGALPRACGVIPRRGWPQILVSTVRGRGFSRSLRFRSM